MRVAILSCFYPFRGGIAQFNATLLGELAKSCEVRAFNFKRQYPSFLFPGKTQYVSKEDEAVPVKSTAVLDTACPFSYVSTWRAVAKWKPDVVIVRYWMSYFAPSLGYVTRRLRGHGVKVVSILDNVIPHERHFFDTPLTKYFLGGSSGCITLCDAVAEDLAALTETKPCKVLFHPLYSHFGEKMPRGQALTGLGLNPERKTLLFFGFIREYKGLDILLEAFSELGSDYQLIVAGEPYGDFAGYQAIIDRHNLGDRVSLNLGYIRDSQVSRFFSGADLCVLPYRSATQSGVGAVSFHFEVPMLVTDTGGLRETIYETGCGLMAEKAEPCQIRRQIENFFSNPGLGIECVENIRKLKRDLSWSNFAAKLLDFTKSIQV